MTTNTSEGRYVLLLTPVKNEESTIDTTIDLVVNQSLTSVEWIIVSDGSIDGTDSIVAAASKDNRDKFLSNWLALFAQNKFAGCEAF